MFFSVDAIDGGLARLVAENEEVTLVPAELLADDVRPGDMVFCREGVYEKDEEHTLQKRQCVEELLRQLLGGEE